ncbi:hypothetical protein BT69DRAFT_274991 [Atractiella rhizophila]|nr:hypothetical protein BT69DRAFT_274991 [Atractiella rhizophila]
MFLASGKKEDHGQYLSLWIAFLLLIIGVAWVDISSRHSYARRVNIASEKPREPTGEIVPLLLFWGFHLIIAYRFTSKHLDGEEKWVLHLLPAIILAWIATVLFLCRTGLKKYLWKIMGFSGGGHGTMKVEPEAV